MNNCNLLNDINDFIEERLNESFTKIIHNKGYKKIEKEHSKLMAKIEKLVKNVELIEEYKKIELKMYEMQLQETYKIAFMDSAKIFLNN